MITEEILKQCIIEDNIIKLPDVQLERNEYLEVAKKLNLIGGKWKGGKIGGFVFEQDPTELLNKILQGDNINLKKEFQFFETPSELADKLVSLVDFNKFNNPSILEPSAGRGAIIKAIHKVVDYKVDCFELMDLNISFLQKLDNINIIGKDFLENNEFKNHYDIIIANPPFSKNQDIKHIMFMYECLNYTGTLVSICSSHFTFASDKKSKEFREFLKERKAKILDIEAGTFKESGTMVNTKIIIINNNI